MMEDEATFDPTKGPTLKRMSTSVAFPFLARLGPEYISAFLHRYDSYCRKVKARVSQLAQESSIPLEPARSVGLVYRIEADQL